MSVLLLSEKDLKAPVGQFRVVKVNKAPEAFGLSPEYFLVSDHSDRYEALRQWRDLMQKNWREDGPDLTYRMYNDEGRVVDALGVHITEEERKAPPGKFRIIAADICTTTIWLVADLDDKEKAVAFANGAYEGPYIGFQVHDDTGAALLPVG